jgi:DNA-binding transcriptional LysR family regulator
MELHQIRYFVVLSRSLNFTRAAERCNITQSALTKAIQRLEGVLGGELIYRERQFTKLTELGKLVLPRLEEILSAADDARRSAEDFRKRKETPLKIGLSTSVSAALLGAIAPKIVALHPTLQIDVVEAPTADLLTLLFEGEIAAALSGDLADGFMTGSSSRRARLFRSRPTIRSPNHHQFHLLRYASRSGSINQVARLRHASGSDTSRALIHPRFRTADVTQAICRR